jgi:hypothetical protein
LAAAVLLLAAGAAAGATASAPGPRAISLDGGATSFLNYDFTSPQVGAQNQDWPVSVIFQGNASVLGLRLALGADLPWPGGAEYASVIQGDHAAWSADPGLKTSPCPGPGAFAVHLRLYAPGLLGTLGSLGSFRSPVLGSYVIGTTHLDVGECGPAPVFGWSEVAEAAVADIARRRGWRVEEDAIDLGNAEAPRWDGAPSGGYPGRHLWWSDGRATVVHVP